MKNNRITNRYLKKIGQELFEIADRKNLSSRLSIASFHSAVVAIILVAFSSYYLFYSQVLQNMVDKAIYKAQEINQVKFAESLYYPNADDFNKYRNNDFKDAIYHYIGTEMSTYLFAVKMGGKDMVGGHPIKESFQVPEDMAERAENAFKILNMVLHSYPFCQSIWYGNEFNGPQLVGTKTVYTAIGWTTTPPKPIIFSDFNELKEWFFEFKELCDVLYHSVYYLGKIESFPHTKYINALADKKYDQIKKYNIFINRLGYSTNPIDPKYIFSDFLVNFPKVYELVNTLIIQIERIEKYKEKKGAQNCAIRLFMIIVFAIFFFGAIIPLVFPFNNRFVQIQLPAFIYTFILGYMLLSLYHAIK